MRDPVVSHSFEDPVNFRDITVTHDRWLQFRSHLGSDRRRMVVEYSDG
jgi:hypothetical protein